MVSTPLVVYVSSDEENGSFGGRLEVRDVPDSWAGEGFDDGEVPCGSLSSRITWVIVGWKRPPYLEWAMRWTGRVLP